MNVCECSQDTTFTHLAKTLYAKLTQFLGGCAVGAIIANGVQKNITFYFITASVSQVWSLLTLSRCPQPLKNALQRDRNKWVSEESDVLTSERSIFYAECELVIRPKPQHRRRHNYFVDFLFQPPGRVWPWKCSIFSKPHNKMCVGLLLGLLREENRETSTTRRPWESEWPIYPATSMLLMFSLL